MIKAVTFDLWNTLIDVKGYKKERFSYLANFLEKKGFFVENNELNEIYNIENNFGHDYSEKAKFRHITTKERLNRIIAQLNVDLSQDQLKDIIDYFETILLKNPPKLKPYVKEILPKIADKYDIGLISDTGITPGSNLRKVLDSYGILKYFTHTTFSDETGYFKPHSYNFKHTLKNLNIQPNEYKNTVHIGDILQTDIAGAKNIGMKGIWLKSMIYYRKDSEKEFMPDAIINSLNELPPALERIFNI